MRYRAEATSVEGFVQQIACCYLRHGYWFYVSGLIPAKKDPRAVDEKLVTKYSIDVSESTRLRRKRAGYANLQYLRHGRFFVILATRGVHTFFDEEGERVRDIRRIPLVYCGYSISYRRGGRTRSGEPDASWHAHVSIEREAYLALRAKVLEMACQHRTDSLMVALYENRFERYAPVRRQLLLLLRKVNEARQRASLSLIPVEVLCLQRRVVKPFGEVNVLSRTV